MRSFALLSFALALGLPACGGESNPTGSDTDQTSNPSTTVDPGTTTTTGTTGPDDPTTTVDPNTTVDPGNTTVEPVTTTVEPETTTVEPETTTVEPETTTGDPETTTDEPDTTTGDPVDVFGACSNEDPMNTGCPDGQLCIDPLNTNNQIPGSFCSPMCSGPNNMCPTPDGVDGAQGICAFGPPMMDPVQCGLVCNPDMDGCPAPMTCFDTGQMNQGQKIGFCVHPV